MSVVCTGEVEEPQVVAAAHQEPFKKLIGWVGKGHEAQREAKKIAPGSVLTFKHSKIFNP